MAEGIGNKIDEWHDGPSSAPIYIYLGWSYKEYQHWVDTSEQPLGKEW